MTLEHRILTLVDRGIIHVSDMCALLGNGAKKEGKRMHDRSLMRFTSASGSYLVLTPSGLQRLNSLDDVAMESGVH